MGATHGGGSSGGGQQFAATQRFDDGQPIHHHDQHVSTVAMDAGPENGRGGIGARVDDALCEGNKSSGPESTHAVSGISGNGNDAVSQSVGEAANITNGTQPIAAAAAKSTADSEATPTQQPHPVELTKEELIRAAESLHEMMVEPTDDGAVGLISKVCGLWWAGQRTSDASRTEWQLLNVVALKRPRALMLKVRASTTSAASSCSMLCCALFLPLSAPLFSTHCE